MRKEAPQRRANRHAAKYVVAAVAVLGLGSWWLACDREPESKEMTLAFIKHYEASYPARAPKDQLEDRLRLVEFELQKQHCDKIGIKRYRCQASVSLNRQPVEDKTGGEDAVFTHDAKGWRFEPADDGSR